MHNTLVNKGYNTLSFDIVENYIQAYGGSRIPWMPFQSIDRPANSQDRRSIEADASSNTGGSTGGRTGLPAECPGWKPGWRPCRSPRSWPWRNKKLAGRFSMSAYRVGETIRKTLAHLRRNGYDVTAAEVAASLAAQGANSIRISDYLDQRRSRTRWI